MRKKLNCTGIPKLGCYQILQIIPPVSKASTERKNMNTPLMVSKNLSVCRFLMSFDLNYLRTGEVECAKKFWGISMSKSIVPNFVF